MSKPLRCRLGLHKWTKRFTDDGGRFKECTRCQAVETHTQSPPGGGFA
ncbi:hypothetical protein [Actinoplanes sp. GCM10030250]